jgi:hypothetical protein
VKIVRTLLRGAGRVFQVVAFLVFRLAKVVARVPALRGTIRVALLGGLAAGLVLGIGATCLVRIPPGTIGVEQVEFGGRGIAERDHPPGIAFRLPVASTWHLVDGGTQVLSFGWESEGSDLPVLDLRTSESTVVKVGATIVHRIRAGEAWQLVRDGLKSAWKARVRSSAEAAIARRVGAMSAADLCDTGRRVEAERELRDELDRELATAHVRVEEVLLTQVWFGPEYEKKLQAKQLSAQQDLLRTASLEVEDRRARIQDLEQEIDRALKVSAASWNERIARRAAEGKSEIAGVKSATKAYDRARRAQAETDRDREILEGERVAARAEALKDSLVRRALALSGGRIWLAEKAADNLNIRQVSLDSRDPRVPSPLDLDGMVKLLIGSRP